MARNAPIRDQRRLELIQATIAVIARYGYSGTTVARPTGARRRPFPCARDAIAGSAQRRSAEFLCG